MTLKSPTCHDCALPRRLIVPGHMITTWTDRCANCGGEGLVSSASDWAPTWEDTADMVTRLMTPSTDTADGRGDHFADAGEMVCEEPPMTPFTPEQLDELEKAAQAAFIILHPWHSWDDFDSRRKARGGLHPWQTQAFEIADAILALAGKGDDWRPIDQYTPRDGGVVLLYHHPLGQCLTGFWDDEAGEWLMCVGCVEIRPTHWMPLPPPPKATSEEREG